MKSLTRLWAFWLIVSYVAALVLPTAALAAGTPPTCVIHITPSTVIAGDSATLTWASTDATDGSITNVGNVGPSGSRQIAPPLVAQTVYVGSFTGPGGTANCSATVQVSYGTGSGAGTTASTDVVAPVTTTAPPVTTSATPPALVTCGTGSDIYGATNCQACNLAKLVSNIINFAIGLSIPIAAVLIAWAGFLYFTAGARPGNIEDAKTIFSSALLGFLIAITGWIVVNTLLHALLDNGKAGFNQSNWFTIQCDEGKRPVDLNINDVLQQVLPGVATTPVGISNNNGYNVAPTGYVLDQNGNIVPVGGQMDQPSGFTLDSQGNIVPTADIAAAATAYYGTDTSTGPDGGNLACAWAVNNILQSQGIAPIDSNSVWSMQQALDAGRGTPDPTPQLGDIVIFGGNMSHVGIVTDLTSTGQPIVSSNSSSQASFTNVGAPPAGSKYYHVNQ